VHWIAELPGQASGLEKVPLIMINGPKKRNLFRQSHIV
jgi:hypothetical protein